MTSFPKGLIFIDAILVVLRFASGAISGGLKALAGVIAKIPFAGKVIATPFNFLAKIFVGGKTVLTFLLIAAAIITLIFIIKWAKDKHDFGKLKRDMKIAKKERAIERVYEGKGTSERLGDLAEDAAKTGLHTVEKVTSFLP